MTGQKDPQHVVVSGFYNINLNPTQLSAFVSLIIVIVL